MERFMATWLSAVAAIQAGMRAAPETNFWNLFRPFVNALRNAGVRHVTGDLIGDTTFFRSPPNGEGWTVNDLEHP